MPVSITTARDPFRGTARAATTTAHVAGDIPVPPMRVPQARVLKALVPAYPEDPPFEWPLVTRAMLGVRAGYTVISGTVTRALNGIQPGSSSGDPHLGLLALGLVEVIVLDIEGVSEDNYRITAAGIRAFREYTAANGDKLPPLKDAASCTNDRYAKE